MVPYRPTPGNQALLQSFTNPNGAAAQASPEVADALQELLQHDVAEWTKHGLEQIKVRTVRRVFRGQLGDVSVHIKVFRADTIAQRAKNSVRTDKAEREARHLQKASSLGLPCVEPLATGVAIEGGHGHSILVTRSVDSEPFRFRGDDSQASEPATEDATAAAAGALVRRVHDAGIEPLDLHPGNLLVTASGDLLLCDLTSLRVAGELSVRRRAAGLAFFSNPIDGGPLDPTTRAFRRGYESLQAMPASFEAELARATRQLRATSIKSFGRRAMRSCKHTEAETRRRATPRFFWHLDDAGRNQGLRDACRAFTGDGLPKRRTGRRGSVWLTDAMAIKERDAGKARKLWLATYWLVFARVPIPTPVALCVHGGRGKVFAQRLTNDDLATELQNGPLPDDAVARAARSLGNSVGRMHAHGLRNRDLKFDNLVRNPETGAVAMVDFDGVTHHAAEETRGCGRDLGRLLAAFRNVGEPGGMPTVQRFLRAYVRARRRMLQDPPMRRIFARAEHRAGEWERAHS